MDGGSKLYWWAYFVFVTLASARFAYGSSPSAPSILANALSIASLLGLLGYLTQRRIGARIVWVVVFCVVVFVAALGFVWLTVLAAHGHPRLKLSALAFAFLLLLPHWYALWRYAFRSPHIWYPAGLAPN